MSEFSDDPYWKKCRYRFCDKDSFLAKRLNQEYCCPEHKTKENNWITREKRLLMKDQMQLQMKNEKILRSFYESGKYIVSSGELANAGFDFNASSQQINDKINQRISRRFFNYIACQHNFPISL